MRVKNTGSSLEIEEEKIWICLTVSSPYRDIMKRFSAL